MICHVFLHYSKVSNNKVIGGSIEHPELPALEPALPAPPVT